MNPPLDLHCGAPDPTASPLDIVQLFALIDTHLSGEIVGEYIPYIMSATVPGPDDTDKIWLQLDSGGRPIALKKYYGGRWRRIYNGMLGEIRLFSGNPNDHNIWDTDGRGKPEKEYDGWQICNGKNGSPDLSDQFILAAHMNNEDGHNGYGTSGWQAVVEVGEEKEVKHTGGASQTMIAMEHLPPIEEAGTGKLILHGNEAKDDSPEHTSAVPIIDVFYAGAQKHDFEIARYGASPNADAAPITQKKFPTIPPFIAMGFITFVGYA
jgi:hypothetical protein